jgi:hypothetical protein
MFFYPFILCSKKLSFSIPFGPKLWNRAGFYLSSTASLNAVAVINFENAGYSKESVGFMGFSPL